MIDSYNKLTLRKFKEFNELASEYDEQDVLDFQVKLISLLADMDEQDVLDLPVNKYSEYVNKLAFLYETPKAKENVPKYIILNNKKYNILKDPSKMTAGQYIDFSTYMENDMPLEYILSTILIPDSQLYGKYDVEEVIEELRDLDVQSALNISFFLQREWVKCTRTTLFSLGWTIRKAAKKAPTPLKKKLKKLGKKTILFSLSGNGQDSFTKFRRLPI